MASASTPVLSASTPVLEFFSGVGGLHYALDRISQESPHHVLMAYDVDEAALATYHLNHPNTPTSTADIRSVCEETIRTLLGGGAPRHMWLLSPPCQPYTRQGPQRGTHDGRANALEKLISLLCEMDETLLPTHLLLENVVGFESSSTRGRLVDALHARRYTTKELWVSPVHVGVCNQR